MCLRLSASLGVASGPVFSTAVLGQIDTVILFICVTHIMLVRSGWVCAAGVVLSVGCWIKLYPAILLVYSLRMPGKGRLVIGFLLATALIPLVMLPVIPLDLYQSYFLHILPSLSGRTITNIYNQSAAAVVTRFSVTPQIGLQTFTAFTVDATVKVCIAITGLSIVAVTTWLVHRRDMPSLALSTSLLAMIGPLAPLGWGHAYVYVLPMLITSFTLSINSQGYSAVMLVIMCYLSVIVPSYHQFGILYNVPWEFQNVVYSRYLFITVALIWYQCAAAVNTKASGV